MTYAERYCFLSISLNDNCNDINKLIKEYFVVSKEVQETRGSRNFTKFRSGFLKVLWFLKTNVRLCLSFKQFNDIICELK